ncbi:hypothetical protein ZIOFF_008047 [Zingiber officinale]|uniref:DUF569 domain-containing protein n=1 Tax=Zingiber officinale TaxID=94328 RepID=A0A8J5LWX5_ZINOF|nr:hypothetical protein ZIOFF_008047 [Zingiber officinale]
MDWFAQAKTVRLRSHQEKYLVAEDDGEHVTQERDGSGPSALWAVERVDDAPHAIRLRSYLYGRYLTSTDESFLLGVTGKKVRLTLPPRLDSSLEWEPLHEGAHVKLKSRYGNYLRGNGGPPPWRNSITHDVPHRHQDWILWDLEIAELLEKKPASPALSEVEVGLQSPNLIAIEMLFRICSHEALFSLRVQSFSSSATLHKVEDRSIYYAVADNKGNVDDIVEWPSVTFNGTSVPELTEKLKEETHLDDIIVCTRNPLNGQLIPLLLHLPPNNTTIHLVVVEANSKDRLWQKISACKRKDFNIADNENPFTVSVWLSCCASFGPSMPLFCSIIEDCKDAGGFHSIVHYLLDNQDIYTDRPVMHLDVFHFR